MATLTKKQKKKYKDQYKKAEGLLKDALNWVTCPLGDVNGKIKKFQLYIDTHCNKKIHDEISTHFEHLYAGESNKILEEYFTPIDEEGNTAWDMNQRFLYN